MEEINLNGTPSSSNKTGIGIIIGLLIAIIIGMGGFIVYDKFIKEDNNKDKGTTPVETNTPGELEDTNKLEYEIIGSEGHKQLIVNGNATNIDNAIGISVIGTIKDMLVVRVGYPGSERYVAVDKKANTILEITGKDAGGTKLANKVIYLKANFPTEVVVEGNSIVATSITSQDIKYSACDSSDYTVIEYKEKIEYKNNQFSDPILVSSLTAKEYRQNNNLKCQ